MAKPNYQFEKRQRDLAKKRKQEEKRQRKLAAKGPGEGADQEPSSSLPASEPSGEADTPAEANPTAKQ